MGYKYKNKRALILKKKYQICDVNFKNSKVKFLKIKTWWFNFYEKFKRLRILKMKIFKKLRKKMNKKWQKKNPLKKNKKHKSFTEKNIIEKFKKNKSLTIEKQKEILKTLKRQIKKRKEKESENKDMFYYKNLKKNKSKFIFSKFPNKLYKKIHKMKKR